MKGNKIFRFLIILISIIAVIRLFGLTSDLRRLQNQNIEVNKKLEMIEKENKNLKDVLNSIDSEEIKDKNARERLNKIKKGEIPIINSQP